MPQPVLNRFEINVYKSKAANDPALVPAVGATVAFSRTGATVKSIASVPPGASDVQVLVYDSGNLQADDMVKVGTTSASLIVQAIVDRSTIIVQNGGMSAVALPVGTRLVLGTRRPTVYVDPVGYIPASGSTLTTDGNGSVVAYVPGGRYDYIVSGAGATTRVFADVQPASGPTGPGWVTATDFSSLQDALDSCPIGGRLYIPGGEYTLPYGGLRIRHPVEIFGDGPVATILHPFTGELNDQPGIVIDASQGTVRNVFLHDFKITGYGAMYGRAGHERNHGIVFVSTASTQVTEVKLERIIVADMGGDGFHLVGANIGAGATVFVYGVAVQAIECFGSGFYIENATIVEMHNAYANGNYLFGAYCRVGMVSWYTSAFERNCRANVETLANLNDPESHYNADLGAQLSMKYCAPARVDACDFESFVGIPNDPSRLARTGVVIVDCSGAMVSNCFFWNEALNPDAGPQDMQPVQHINGRAIYVTAEPNSGWVTIMPNYISNVATPVEIGTQTNVVSVLPQRVEQNPGTMPSAKSVRLPGLAIPSVTASEVAVTPGPRGAQLLFDSTNRRLLLWDGGTWRVVYQVN